MTISKNEIETFQDNVGKLIVANSYWSTSCNRSFALRFAKNDFDMIPVLLEIEYDLHDCNDSAIFVDISSLSEFPEEEVLFDAGSIFLVEKISEEKVNDINIYVTQIKTSRNGQEIVNQYLEENRREMEYESPKIMLGILLKRIGKSKKSLHYFEELLRNPGEENMSHIHNRIGIALKYENKCDLAIEHFNIAYDLAAKTDPPERKQLALILHGIGLVHSKRRDFPKALGYLCRAAYILEQEGNGTDCNLAAIYGSIGRVYSYRKYYENAYFFHHKAWKIRVACLPPDHVNHALSYADTAKTFWLKGNYQKALEYHLKALEIRQKSLLSQDLNIASSLYHVGKTYKIIGDPDTALNYYLKSLEMTKKCLPPSQQRGVPGILEDIALIHSNNFDKVLEYRLEALEAQTKTEPIDYSYLARILDNIAFTYKSMNDITNSVKYYEEAVSIREKELSEDKFNLVRSLDWLSSAYEKNGELGQTLNCHNKIMDLCTQHYHSYHTICKKTKRNIKRIKRKYQ